MIKYFQQQRPELDGTKMTLKVIINPQNLDYFMTIKKLIRYKVCQTKFLSGQNFVISYILGRKIQKADLLTKHLNDVSLNNNDNCQQHLLQTIPLVKRLEIIEIERKNNSTIMNQVV